MALHQSGEDYLEAILVLQKQRGMVRSVDVARYLDVSKPSVCHAVATLRDGGFLTMDSDYFLHLTDVGQMCIRDRLDRAFGPPDHSANSLTDFFLSADFYEKVLQGSLWNYHQCVSAGLPYAYSSGTFARDQIGCD